MKNWISYWAIFNPNFKHAMSLVIAAFSWVSLITLISEQAFGRAVSPHVGPFQVENASITIGDFGILFGFAVTILSNAILFAVTWTRQDMRIKSIEKYIEDNADIPQRLFAMESWQRNHEDWASGFEHRTDSEILRLRDANHDHSNQIQKLMAKIEDQ